MVNTHLVDYALSLCVVGSLSACRQTATQPAALAADSRERTAFLLRGGKEVTVTGVGCQKAPDGLVTLSVDYTSELPTKSYEAVAPEAVEVWADFQPLADAKGASAVMIRAHERPHGPLVFPFTKMADDGWQKPEVRTLQGGKQVLVVRATKDRGQLFIDYVTHIPLRDVCSLEPEADAVWSLYRPVAEQAGISKAFVSPSETPVGGSISLSFTREAGGGWTKQRLCRSGT